MLHDLKGDRLETAVSDAIGADAEFRAVAVRDGAGISAVFTNPTGDVAVTSLEIDGLSDGEYRVEAYHCNARDNNIVTGHGTGVLKKTAEAIRFAKDGVLKHRTLLEQNSFALFRFTKQ
jgi:hypothetical protein